MKSSPILNRNQADFLTNSLTQSGLAVLPDFIARDHLLNWNSFFDQKLKLDHFKSSQIGSYGQKSLNAEIRSDLICWLDGHEPELSGFWALNHELMHLFNSEFYLSLKSIEAHFALYQKGSFYAKHWDRQKNSNHRHISMICYLNLQWSKEWGGQLEIYDPQNPSQMLHLIDPNPGQVVLFRSELFPHAVRPSTQERRSLTGWFRDDDFQRLL